VRIPESLAATLAAARPHARCAYVIELGGYPLGSVKKAFRETARRAGFPPNDVTPNVLRHTAATWWAQDGVALFEIAGNLGHTSLRMVERHYAHHHPDDRDRSNASTEARMGGLETAASEAARRFARRLQTPVSPQFHPSVTSGAPEASAKSLKGMVGAAGFEPTTPTMST
jgi:hypothetical protein